jgi:acetyl/propionyl-CoA carboxylase alpha subunit
MAAGLTWIGPSPESIDMLGSKTEARKKATLVGVPTTAGSAGGLSDKDLAKEGERVGFPVIIKAVGGGGGRGMRIVNSAEEMLAILPRARAEAKKNFANEDVYIERYINNPRHIEVQVFGDSHGKVLHFGTRDCTTQRRHQKLIEEAPAPFLDPELREKIHEAAVKVAKSVGYTNAGTAEFLVQGNEFYFLEMNTRIQVEHPVTETVTGVDLVQLQLRVASGEPIPFSQKEVSFKGHAIEFRVYAEDPARNFAPCIGKIQKLTRTKAPYVREDFGYEQGDEVSVHYDAMLSKVIVSGGTRNEAIDRAYQFLKDYKVEGFPTNVEFHRWMLRNPKFRAMSFDIAYLDREFSGKCIEELRASEVKDPRHRPAEFGVEHVELVKYACKTRPVSYVVEITHRADGVFVAVPLNARGQRALPRNCRASNGYRTVIESVTADVLEKVGEEEIFGVV